MRVVVLGGYGNFGARVCRALSEEDDFAVVAASRHPEQATRHFAAESMIQAARLDLAAPDFPEALRKLSPGIVIHCAGPFQDQDDRVVAARPRPARSISTWPMAGILSPGLPSATMQRSGPQDCWPLQGPARSPGFLLQWSTIS